MSYLIYMHMCTDRDGPNQFGHESIHSTVYRKMFTTNNFHEFREWSKFVKISIVKFICI